VCPHMVIQSEYRQGIARAAHTHAAGAQEEVEVAGWAAHLWPHEHYGSLLAVVDAWIHAVDGHAPASIKFKLELTIIFDPVCAEEGPVI
jgi:hypothetical protein